VTVTSTTYLFLHSIPVITTLCPAAVVGALLHTKPASTRIYSPIFPYASTFFISQNSLKVLTATCYAGLALSENTARHARARIENTGIFSSHVFQFLQRMQTMHDFRLPAQCKWGLCSHETLHSTDWYFVS